MCRLLLTALGAALLLGSLSHASVLPSPDSNSLSPSKDPWQEPVPDAIINDVTNNNIIEDITDDIIDDDVTDDDTADDLADDAGVEEELTEEEKAVGDHVTFPLAEMGDQELRLYLTLEEQIFLAQTDEHIAFKLLKEKRSLYTKGGDRLRRKRVAPLIARAAFTVGRALFRRFARSGVTRSGSRLTRHYNGRGSYSDAVRDFNRMRPDNVRGFNGRISGQTGTMGRHRVTVRDGSSGPNSRPTLEIRSHGGDLVRKFRYNN